MWDTLLAINSFVVWPLTGIFLVYAAGRTLLFFDWKLLVVAIILFLMSIAAGFAMSILNG